MNNARTGTAPCGHPGTYVTATFVTCDQRCGFSSDDDAIPAPIEEGERTRPLCKACGSRDTEPFATDAFLDCYHCLPCGKIFWV